MCEMSNIYNIKLQYIMKKILKAVIYRVKQLKYYRGDVCFVADREYGNFHITPTVVYSWLTYTDDGDNLKIYTITLGWGWWNAGFAFFKV